MRDVGETVEQYEAEALRVFAANLNKAFYG